MNYTELLTIAMPVFNRTDYFLEALESAINQTVKCNIIVVDNCSPHDYFKNICIQKDITYYRNDTNIGLTANFNRCFELAKTEFVLTFQDDDILSPIYVESFINALKMHPEIDVFFTDFILNTPSGNIPHRHILPFGYMADGTKVIEYAIKYRLGFPYLNSSIKRSKFTGLYSKYQGSNDWVWIYENAEKLSFYGNSNVLYQFRQHSNQDTKNNTINHRFIFPYIYDVILKGKVSGKEIKKKAAKNAFWALVALKASAKKITVNEFLKEENKFSSYMKNRLNSDKLLNAIFKMPRGVVNFIFRSLRKLGLAG